MEEMPLFMLLLKKVNVKKIPILPDKVDPFRTGSAVDNELRVAGSPCSNRLWCRETIHSRAGGTGRRPDKLLGASGE